MKKKLTDPQLLSKNHEVIKCGKQRFAGRRAVQENQDNQDDQFFYIIGEHQNGIVPERAEILAFTQEHMQQIESEELAAVLANVFGRGHIFPGPEEALTTVIHEFVRRDAEYCQAVAGDEEGCRCTLISVFKRLHGEILVKVAAVIPIFKGSLHIDQPEQFQDLLLESLPAFQEAFIQEAYAKDSKLISLIKDATMYHINKKLN